MQRPDDDGSPGKRETCKTYTVEETGRLLGIGRNQAYEAARRGDFPVIKIGKRLLVPKTLMDRMLGLI